MTMARPRSKKGQLTPPDLERCQALRPNGHNFMTLGGRPGFEQCESKPTVIVTENELDENGQKGSMSLCASCLLQFEKQMPKNYATATPIRGRGKKR